MSILFKDNNIINGDALVILDDKSIKYNTVSKTI